jgi:hypothetical protein
MGRVWLARDEVLRRDVAIKQVILPAGLSDHESVELRLRTMREARAAARLNHPNVVRIYDVVQGEEQPWIVMEYVRARSLLQVIRENGPLPVDQAARIGLAVLSALEAANQAGVLHGDVKPSNVLISDEGRVVLTDFGAAMLDESDGTITRTGIILGSPDYIAPERVRTGISTREADLWSLGATLYEAVEGRAPYRRGTSMGTLLALATERPDPIRRAGALKPVLNGLLQKNPKARLNAAELEHRLRRLVDIQKRRVPLPRRSPESNDIGRTESASGGAVVLVDHASPEPATAALETARSSEATARALPGRFSTRPMWTPVFVPWRAPWLRSVATVAAVVLLAVGLAVSAAKVRGGGSPNAAGLNSAGVIGAARSLTIPTDPEPPPAGFTLWLDPSRYRLAYPAGWDMLREDASVMLFSDPDARLTLRVRAWDSAGPEPVAVLRSAEQQAKLDNYRLLRMQPSAQDHSAQDHSAEWEYTFNGPTGPIHGLERAFVMSNCTMSNCTYVIQWRTPEADWSANLTKLRVITDSFRSTS